MNENALMVVISGFGVWALSGIYLIGRIEGRLGRIENEMEDIRMEITRRRFYDENNINQGK
jgi:hypothetical protein